MSRRELQPAVQTDPEGEMIWLRGTLLEERLPVLAEKPQEYLSQSSPEQYLPAEIRAGLLATIEAAGNIDDLSFKYQRLIMVCRGYRETYYSRRNEVLAIAIAIITLVSSITASLGSVAEALAGFSAAMSALAISYLVGDGGTARWLLGHRKYLIGQVVKTAAALDLEIEPSMINSFTKEVAASAARLSLPSSPKEKDKHQDSE